MRPICAIVLCFALLSCGKTKDSKSKRDSLKTARDSTKATEGAQLENQFIYQVDTSKVEDGIFNFSDFKIMKGQLGEIKIGMTIREAQSKFKGLTKKMTPVYNYGYDGEEPCYSYYLHDTLVLALIPKYNTDTVSCIVATHKNLQTTNGLNPNSTVNDLLGKYPNLEVGQNMENGWESISDKENNWSFDFVTDEKNQIAEYPVPGKPAKPKRLTAKSDWIMIYDR